MDNLAEVLKQLPTHSAMHSDNFRRWLQRQARQRLSKFVFVAYPQVCPITGDSFRYRARQTQAGHIFVGLDGLDAGWLHGSRLSDVICNGARARIWAHPPQFRYEIIPAWFRRYIEEGKCCIDPEHTLPWMGDDERWIRVRGQDRPTRKCRWCGHLQSQYVEIQTHKVWRNEPNR